MQSHRKIYLFKCHKCILPYKTFFVCNLMFFYFIFNDIYFTNFLNDLQTENSKRLFGLFVAAVYRSQSLIQNGIRSDHNHLLSHLNLNGMYLEVCSNIFNVGNKINFNINSMVGNALVKFHKIINKKKIKSRWIQYLYAACNNHHLLNRKILCVKCSLLIIYTHTHILSIKITRIQCSNACLFN